MTAATKLLLLDRDGVINENLPQSVLHISKFQFIENSLKALRLLKEVGVTVAVCTNQACVGRGLISAAYLNDIHQHMCAEVQKHGGEIARVYAATNHPKDFSERRKPGAGMLLEALQDFGANAHETPFIGDNVTDLQAAHKAGCPRVLVRTGHGANMEKNGLDDLLQPVEIYNNLFDAVTGYLNQTH